MNRIQKLFEEKKSGILSVYFTAGYPNLEDTLPAIRALEREGADMLEIGVPFSDPMADGPVIQESGARALKNGMSLRLLFEQLEKVRDEVKIPLALMSYLNPLLQYGVEKVFKKAKEIGLDALIIPDLPFSEYMLHYRELSLKHGLDVCMLITPETSEQRIRLIDEYTGGFIYMVSAAAVTGARDSFPKESLDYFSRVNAMGLRHPRLIGFGVSNAKTFSQACENSSGGIIGSRFIRLLGECGGVEEAAKKLVEELGGQP